MTEYPPTFLPGWHSEDLVAKMRYSRLGRTDLLVSQLGFGGCVVGGVYPDKGDLEEIFQVSLDPGILRELGRMVIALTTKTWFMKLNRVILQNVFFSVSRSD